jgi:hypothetical protein
MNINKLTTGLLIKNYQELFNLTDESVKTSNSKNAQLKELERLCLYHKEGNKFIIDEIYDKPLLKQDNRTLGNNYKVFKELNITKEKWNNIGIYCILKDNDIYIGSKFSGYKGRFQKHYYNYNGDMKHTYDLLQNGATFNILYDMTGIEDEVLIRQVENEYIQYFINSTNYNVVNKREKAWSYSKNTEEKYKTIKIKVKLEDYDKTMQLLIDNGLIELSEDNNSNDTLSEINTDTAQEIKFDMDNVPF